MQWLHLWFDFNCVFFLIFTLKVEKGFGGCILSDDENYDDESDNIHSKSWRRIEAFVWENPHPLPTPLFSFLFFPCFCLPFIIKIFFRLVYLYMFIYVCMYMYKEGIMMIKRQCLLINFMIEDLTSYSFWMPSTFFLCRIYIWYSYMTWLDQMGRLFEETSSIFL